MSRNGTISFLSTKGRRRDLNNCKKFAGKKKQCHKDAGTWNGDMERIRDEVAERGVQLQELERKF